MSALRSLVGSNEPVIVVSTRDFAPGLTNLEGVPLQHAKLREICSRLDVAGAAFRLLYSPASRDDYEVIDQAMMENLFASELTYLDQDHD